MQEELEVDETGELAVVVVVGQAGQVAVVGQAGELVVVGVVVEEAVEEFVSETKMQPLAEGVGQYVEILLLYP